MMASKNKPTKASEERTTSKVGGSTLENLKPVKQRWKQSGKQAPLVLPPSHISTVDNPLLGRLANNISNMPCTSSQVQHKPNLPPQSSHLPQKFKLQLFPIDENTRNVLQQGQHNPYLELTLGRRKKISSVVRHINAKWGHLNPVKGELVLFPEYARVENVFQTKRWTLNGPSSTAADVHAAVGHPAVFRLRYGWVSNLVEANPEPPSMIRGAACSLNREAYFDDDKASYEPKSICSLNQEVYFDDEKASHERSMEMLGIKKPIPSYQGKECSDVRIPTSRADASSLMNLNAPVGNQESEGRVTLDSYMEDITNISFSTLLSKTLPSQAANPSELHKNLGSQLPATCDSIDAALATLIANQKHAGLSEAVPSQSLLDAELARQPFQFQNSDPPSTVKSEVQNDAVIGSSILNLFPCSRRIENKQSLEEVEGESTKQSEGESNPQLKLTRENSGDLVASVIPSASLCGVLDSNGPYSRLILGGDSVGLDGMRAAGGASPDTFQDFSLFP